MNEDQCWCPADCGLSADVRPSLLAAIEDILKYKHYAGVASASAEVSGGRIRSEAGLQADRGVDKFAALVLMGH